MGWLEQDQPGQPSRSVPLPARKERLTNCLGIVCHLPQLEGLHKHLLLARDGNLCKVTLSNQEGSVIDMTLPGVIGRRPFAGVSQNPDSTPFNLKSQIRIELSMVLKATNGTKGGDCSDDAENKLWGLLRVGTKTAMRPDRELEYGQDGVGLACREAVQ